MVLPWLQQPLTPLLWPALAVSTFIFLLTVARTRRTSDTFPLVPRSLAIALILTCAPFGALAYGANLSHPTALYAAPILIVISSLLARSAWHASDQSQHQRTLAAPLAAASMFVTGAMLLFEIAGASTPAHFHGRWDAGLGWGEAAAFLLPAIGAAIVPLTLLPADHPRTAAVRRAVVLFVASLVAVTAATVAAGAVAVTAPLAEGTALGDRYIYLNAVLPVPALLATLCAAAVSLAAARASWMARTLILLLTACAAFPLVAYLAKTYGARTAYEFDAVGPPVCLAAGLAIGTLLAPITRFSPILRAAAVIAAVLAAASFTQTLHNQSGSPFEPTANAAIALIGLLTAATLSAAHTAIPQTPQREPLAVALIAACLLLGSGAARMLELRSQLTWQAARFSQTFKYESITVATPEIQSWMKITHQGLHMSPDGFRWAWVVPDAISWTRDGAWRDAIIIADHAQPRMKDADTSGPFYGAKITEADRKKLSDVSFTDAKYVAVIQPGQEGKDKLIVHGIAARQATPAQLLSFMRLEPANVRAWLGVALGLPLACVIARRKASPVLAVAVSAAASVGAAALLGFGGVTAMLIVAGVAVMFASLRRDDQWRAPAALAVLMSVALALGGLLLKLNDLV